MISRILAADLPAKAGQRVMIAGWLHRKRQLKSMTFLIVRDRSGLAQAVLTDPAAIQAAAALPEETVIQVNGTVTASSHAPGGAELTGPVIAPLSGPAAAPPFDRYRPAVTASLPAILDGAPTTLRHPRLHRHEDYLAALAERGEDPGPYAGYLQVFAHGMPPHGGFAIGLERWTARLTGAANVRPAALFPVTCTVSAPDSQGRRGARPASWRLSARRILVASRASCPIR
jgi:aspartyl/asparaginyl-tRNA synthetase